MKYSARASRRAFVPSADVKKVGENQMRANFKCVRNGKRARDLWAIFVVPSLALEC